MTLILELLVFFMVTFVAASPVTLSNAQAEAKPDPRPSESETVDIFPSSRGNGDELFASDQWKRSTTRPPTKVRRGRNSETNIFQHDQWDSRDLNSDAPHSVAQIFAYDQWENLRRVGPDDDAKQKQARRSQARGQADFSAYERRAESTSRPPGPIFFAKVQWDE